ncbi:MAG: hypothetical protein ACRC0S_03830 [Fusobacteriaceae bacterium]
MNTNLKKGVIDLKSLFGVLIIGLAYISSGKEIIGVPATGRMMTEETKISINVENKLSNKINLATGTMLIK